MALSREQKIAKARELRAAGKKSREIAEIVGAPASTVRNWYLGGECEDCGQLIEGGSGQASPKRCTRCAARAAALWTREKIIQRIREWEERYGCPPSAYDWAPDRSERAGSPAAALVRQRYEAGDWPAQTVVVSHFASWNEAIRAAGLTPRESGKRGRNKLSTVAA